MKPILLIVLVVSITLAEEALVLKQFAVNNNQFASELYKEVTKSHPNNFLVCPLSLETFLTILHTGAAGKTAEQLSKSLHLPQGSAEIQATYQVLTHLLQGTPDYNFTNANKIYDSKDSYVENQFKVTARNVFNAEIQTLNFENKEEAAKEFNSWLEEKTHRTIEYVVDEELLRVDGTLLINTLFFSGKWSSPFSKHNTRLRTFRRNDQRLVNVYMMEHTSNFVYYENSTLGAKFLKIGYAGGGDVINLVIVLPNDKEGLPVLEASIEDVFRPFEASTKRVQVVIPKFTMEDSFEMKPILQNLGIVDIFEDTANIPGLSNPPVNVSKITHRAVVAIREETLSASAATSLQQFYLNPSLYASLPPEVDLPPPPELFIADHPFMFYLTIQDAVIFAGKYSWPLYN